MRLDNFLQSLDEQSKAGSESKELSSEDDTAFGSYSGSCQNLIKYFDNKTDLDISSESDEDSEAAPTEVGEKFKRKANESPETRDGFERLVSKKEQKKSKKHKLH